MTDLSLVALLSVSAAIGVLSLGIFISPSVDNKPAEKITSMKVESINDTLRSMSDPPTGVRVEGVFIILSYGPLDVYYNDQGRQVFTVFQDAPVVTPLTYWPSLWQRLVSAFNLIFFTEL